MVQKIVPTAPRMAGSFDSYSGLLAETINITVVHTVHSSMRAAIAHNFAREPVGQSRERSVEPTLVYTYLWYKRKRSEFALHNLVRNSSRYTLYLV